MLGCDSAVPVRGFLPKMRESERRRHGLPAVTGNVQDYDGALPDSVQQQLLSRLLDM